MEMDCDAVRGNVDAWALGALDAADVPALEAHIASCADCAAVASEARETASLIAMAVPLASAGPAVKSRVMAAAGVLADAPSRRAAFARWPAAAAAAVVFGLGALAWAGYMQVQVNGLRDRDASARSDATAQSDQFATVRAGLVQASTQSVSLASSQDAVLDIVSQADVRRMPMSGTAIAPSASGRYIWSRAGELGVLVASNLPSLPEGKSYAMWIVYEDAWINGGLFTVDDTGTGRLIVRDFGEGADDRGAFRGFAVTVEPSTGVTKHTGATYLQSPID